MALHFFFVGEGELANGDTVAHANSPLDFVGQEGLMIALVVLEPAGSSLGEGGLAIENGSSK